MKDKPVIGKAFHKVDEEEQVFLPESSSSCGAVGSSRSHEAQPVIAIPLPNGANSPHHNSCDHGVIDTFDDDVTNNSTIPFAPVLMTYDENGPEAQNLATKQKTRLAEDIGRVKGLTEKEQIEIANYHSKVKPEIERMRIINGTDLARQRVVEGLEVRQDLYHCPNHQQQQQGEWGKGGKEKRDNKDQQCRNPHKEKNVAIGYQVKDYEVSEYAGYEYDSSYEYKSIYESS
jgi:hypothetical protein